jgi:hypothetical protein
VRKDNRTNPSAAALLTLFPANFQGFHSIRVPIKNFWVLLFSCIIAPETVESFYPTTHNTGFLQGFPFKTAKDFLITIGSFRVQ